MFNCIQHCLQILYYWPEEDQIKSKHLHTIKYVRCTSCVSWCLTPSLSNLTTTGSRVRNKMVCCRSPRQFFQSLNMADHQWRQGAFHHLRLPFQWRTTYSGSSHVTLSLLSKCWLIHSLKWCLDRGKINGTVT